MTKSENKFQYVSNAGIILSIGEKSVGIDCFCRDSSKLYQDTPLEIRQELKLDVLIFTHEHEDHFCVEYVKEAWVRNRNLKIYAGKSVVQILEQAGIDQSSLIEIETPAYTKFGLLEIRFIKSLHEGEQYADIQNLSLLINKEDKHYVVPGDAMPSREFFEQINAWSKQIDWFFAPFPYVGLRSTRKLLAEYFDIKNIFVLHQPRAEADTQGWGKNAKRVCLNANDGLPDPIFPEKLGEWYFM